MSNKKLILVLSCAFLLSTIFLGVSISAVRSMPLRSEYQVPSMNPTMSTQQASNWCGPAALQSAIDYVTNRIPQATLWAYMRDSARFSGIFLASSFFLLPSFVYSRSDANNAIC